MKDHPAARPLRWGLVFIVVPCLVLIAMESYEAIDHASALARDREWVVHTFTVIDTTQELRNKSVAQNGHSAVT